MKKVEAGLCKNDKCSHRDIFSLQWISENGIKKFWKTLMSVFLKFEKICTF